MATIVANPVFDATKLAESLHAAMAGTGTRESDLIEVLSKHDNAQLQEVRTVYKGTYGQDLIEKVKEETSGNFRNACAALLEDRIKYQADLLHGALAGAGTDDLTLNDVLGVMDADVVAQVKARYRQDFEKVLETDVMGDTSGNHEKMLVGILEGGRPAGDDVDREKVVEEAKELYEKGEGKIGTDNAYFRSIFLMRSWAQLKATMQAYNRQVEGHDIETAIKKEFTGNSEALLLTIARFSLDRHAYFANILKDCIEGVGTQDDRLIHTLVRRCEIDLVGIKREFFGLYGDQLAAAVAGDTSGDYEKLLVAVINGNQ